MPVVEIEHVHPARTALIVVDMQNDFLREGAALETPMARAMLPRLAQALALCRDMGIRVVYTAHVHRTDGSDLGLFSLNRAVASGAALAAGSTGAEIHPMIAPRENEPVVTKNRFSGFFGTDLDTILRGWDVDTVIVAGATTENCCHATARDALYRDYKVVFLADATATFDYPDRGYGALSADEVHSATLVILAASTAHVMSVDELRSKIVAP